MTPANANRYYSPLLALFRQLVVLNGVLFQLSHHLKTRTVDVEALLKKFPNRNVLFAGAALIIMDLTEVQPDGYPVVFPVGSPRQQAKCGPAVFKVLQAAYPGRRTAVGYRFGLDQIAAQNAIEMLGEYAFLIYREASKNDGLDPAVFRQMRIRE